MKLIVTGATGFVGMEVIRQAVLNPNITSVVALARKRVTLPETISMHANRSKLESVLLEDWTSPYPDSVKDALRDADCGIWNLAITPSVAPQMDFAEVTKICYDYTMNGLENMAAVANSPFRFVYTSGLLVERNQTKPLDIWTDYRRMRGRVETGVIDFAAQHAPAVQATVAKAGFIDGPGREHMVETVWKGLVEKYGSYPRAHVSEVAAALIYQCLHDITKDPLDVGDLVRMGRELLREEDYLH